MLVETAKDQININQIFGQKRKTFVAEGEIIVNDIKPDVLSILSIDGIVHVYKKEIMDGKVRLDGSINTYIIYLADSEEGKVRSLNTVLDFTEIVEIEKAGEGMMLNEDICLVDFESAVLNSRKINVKANLEVSVELSRNENIEVINRIDDIEDIQTLKEQASVNSLIGQSSDRIYAKDNIKINELDELAEIMKVKVRITNKEEKVSHNKILVKADCDVNIMYLTEDNRINSVEAKLPVMGFVEIPNVNEDNICDVKYKLKNIIVKPEIADSHSLYVEAEVEVICFVYERKHIDIIEDLYSLSSNVECKERMIRTMTDTNRVENIHDIKEKIFIPEIGANKIYNIGVKSRINNRTMKNGKIALEGEIDLEILFEFNNSLDKRNTKIPFSFEIADGSLDEKSDIQVSLEIVKEDFIVGTDGNIEASISLKTNLGGIEFKELKIIEEIMFENDDMQNKYSMVIYFVKPDDTVWKIAKKMKSRVEDIRRVNEISDDRLSTGQQLYIPKIVRMTTAVT